MTVISDIQSSVSNLVSHASYFTEHYHNYVAERNKNSVYYNHLEELALNRAKNSAKETIKVCEELGFDPFVVCRDQIEFLASSKTKTF